MSNKFITKKVTETYEIDYKGLADHLEEIILRDFEHDFEDQRGERALMAMHMEDTAQYLNAIDSISKGYMSEAKSIIQGMDTAPRGAFFDMFEKETGMRLQDIFK